MTMEVDRRPPQPHLGGMGGYDTKFYPQQPEFTNPWQPTSNATSAPAPASVYSSSYHSSAATPPSVESAASTRAPSMSMGYTSNPAASSLGSDLVPSRSYNSTYSTTSAPTSQTSYASAPAPSPAPHYSPEQHQYAYDADLSRRSSYQQSNSSRGASFSDEIASARGMVAMANSQDSTPRSVYGGAAARPAAHDAYGFPAAPHSQNSSISSASGYPYYSGSYSGSVDGSSVTDYSSASDDARTLPGTSQLINGFPPEPGAMMTQFNAKLSPSAQKKHKCKICEKRFTRPSSLQTHMYSHTGEKPFACDHEGCGRHFSVVSNLRRHKKVHKGEPEQGSDNDDS